MVEWWKLASKNALKQQKYHIMYKKYKKPIIVL